MASGIPAEIPCVVDHWNMTVDESINLAQHLSVLDDPPFFQSGCFRPGYLQNQVMCFDDVAEDFSIGIASLIINAPCFGYCRVEVVHRISGAIFSHVDTTSVIFVLDTASVLANFSLGSLETFRDFPRGTSNSAVLVTLSFSTLSLEDSAISLPPLFAPMTAVALLRSVHLE